MKWDATFSAFPELETKRCILRKIEISDADHLFEYLSRKEVTKYYDIETLTSKKEAEELIRGLLQRYKIGKQIRWGIILKNSGKFIGTCGFHALEREHFKAEVGYELHPDYWGKGIMTEVLAKIVQYGFLEMGLNRIEAFYMPANIPSKKVLEKNGFQYEGLLRKRFYTKGDFVDVVLCSLLKEEYLMSMSWDKTDCYNKV